MSTHTTDRFASGASRGWLKHFELAWRALGRTPSFTVPAVVTIALGIGAATAVFSLVYAVLLRPFPYPDADRLVRVFTVAESEQGAERNSSLLDITTDVRAFWRTSAATRFSIRRSRATVWRRPSSSRS